MEENRRPVRNTTRSGQRVVKIAFFRPDETNRSFLGSVASCMTANESGKTFSHAELIFSDGSVTSITQDPGVVHYDQTRMLSNPRYRCFFELHVSPREEKVMEMYAQACALDEVEFNGCGMYWNFLPCCGSLFTVRKQGKAFFCSEYIVTLLQRIGYLTELDPATTSPNDLYLAVKHIEGIAVGLNEKMYRLQKPPNSIFIAPPRQKSTGLKHK